MTGPDRHAAIVVRRVTIERLAKFAMRRRIERVRNVGPIHRHGHDRPVAHDRPVEHDRIGDPAVHGRTLLPVRAASKTASVTFKDSR